MFKQRSAVAPATLGLLAVLVGLSVESSTAWSQELNVNAGTTNARDRVTFQIDGPSQRLEMVVNSSRILTLDQRIPRLLVSDPATVRATPLSPNQIQVSALRPGVTQLNVWDENEKVHTIDLVVYADARALEDLIKTEFPEAAVRVRPLSNSLYLTGYVPSANMVTSIVQMAEDYYPSVINNLSVGGVQQILLKVKVMEVSRTKLRSLGFDWAYLSGSDYIIQSVSGLLQATGGQIAGTGSSTINFGLVDGNSSFFGFVEALRQYNLAKVLAEPQLVTVSGRAASFNSGGEFPIVVPQSLGTVSIEYRQFGTRVDFVPLVLGNGNIHLEVRPQVSEIDAGRGATINGNVVPGLRTRWVDTAVEMKAGQTLALAGLIQTRTEAINRGIPWLADLPWFGVPFRRVEEEENEIELLILVTPEFINPIDANEVPPCGPGLNTTNPSDIELFGRGYLEVPRCGCGDGNCQSCQQGMHAVPPVEVLESVTPADPATSGGAEASFSPNARRLQPQYRSAARTAATPTQPVRMTIGAPGK